MARFLEEDYTMIGKDNYDYRLVEAMLFKTFLCPTDIAIHAFLDSIKITLKEFLDSECFYEIWNSHIISDIRLGYDKIQVGVDLWNYNLNHDILVPEDKHDSIPVNSIKILACYNLELGQDQSSNLFLVATLIISQHLKDKLLRSVHEQRIEHQ